MSNLFSTFSKNLNFYKVSLLTAYAQWRIRPTKEEKFCYNTTKKILLTFDDYAEPARVESILKILKEENIKAAFFLIGEWSEKNIVTVNKIKNAGHWLGTHTKSHKNLLGLTDKEVKTEILESLPSTLLRPPFGKYNKRIRNIAQKLGYKICYWSIDSDDWQGISSDAIVEKVLQNLHEGACILLHLNGKNTLKALPTLIKEIRKQGYELCFDRKELEI